VDAAVPWRKTVSQKQYVGEEKQKTLSLAKLVEVGRRLYREKGPSYSIWWFLKEIWKQRKQLVRFRDIYRFHHAISGVKSKNSTWKVLKRLEFYGFVRNLGGWYMPVMMDNQVVEGSIDFRRVRRRDQVLKSRKTETKLFSSIDKIPSEAKRVIKKARELIEKGEKWRAVDFLAHSLLGIRQTGVLLARKDSFFIYYEGKTGKMHVLKSEKLARIFDGLGIESGLLYNHRMYEADNIIRDLYGSHDIARRVHYLLKEQGLFTYPAEKLFYKIAYDFSTRTWKLVIYTFDGTRLIKKYEIPLQNTAIARDIRNKSGAIIAREHVKPENEETYFRRTKGML